MNSLIIIPAHNEAKQIGALVQRLKQKNYDVLVVDDGSTDKTGDIAKQNGAVVLTHEEKKGKGCSLRNGFDYALAHQYTGVVTMDGDGQHDVADLEYFLEKAEQNPNCIISGNRMHNPKGMPWIRLVVNWVMSSMISFLCKQKVPDSQCGFRYLGADVMRNMSLSCRDFEIESETLVSASRQGYPIYAVPIQTIYRNELSKINPCIDTIRFLSFFFRELFFPSKCSKR